MSRLCPFRLVFTDEKPIKYENIYRIVRRDPRNDTSLRFLMNTNGKNSYNILVAMTVKEGVRAVDYVVLKTITTAPIFVVCMTSCTKWYANSR